MSKILKDDLITRLQAIPGNVPVAIMDIKRSIGSDGGDGATEGIWNISDVSQFKSEPDDENAFNFIALSFDNPDYDDNGVNTEMQSKEQGLLDYETFIKSLTANLSDLKNICIQICELECQTQKIKELAAHVLEKISTVHPL